MQRASWTVLKGALLCAFAGPTIGVVVVAAASEPEESRMTTFLVGILFYWPYATFLLGPVAGLLGAFGTWMQIQLCRRGYSLRALSVLGIGTGIILGALCPALSLLVFAVVVQSKAAPSELMDAQSPYTILGAIAGAVLGLVVSVFVVRPAYAGTKDM